MQKFDVFEIAGDLYLVVYAEHLLELNTVVLLPFASAFRYSCRTFGPIPETAFDSPKSCVG